MIQPAVLAERRDAQSARLEPLRCSRCGNVLVHAFLTAPSRLKLRCHHNIKVDATGRMVPKGQDGKRETCGYENTVGPTR